MIDARRLHSFRVQLFAVMEKRKKCDFSFFLSIIWNKTRRLHLHPYAHKGKKEKVSFFLFLSICLGRWRVCFHPARRGARVPTHCHPELVVARLCCQHCAERQNARLARRLLLFPKISLRCDFREPCFLSRAVEWVLRGAYRKTNAPTFMPSPFLRGKGDRTYRDPKKYRRTFWEEERQAQRARRQTQCAVCLGALPATRMRVVLSLLHPFQLKQG